MGRSGEDEWKIYRFRVSKYLLSLIHESYQFLPVKIPYNDRVENEIVIVTIHSKRFAFCSVILVVIVASIIEKLLESGIGWLPSCNTVRDETALTTTSPCNLRRDNIRWTLMTPAQCYRQCYRRGHRLFLYPVQLLRGKLSLKRTQKDYVVIGERWQHEPVCAIVCNRVWGGRR